MTRPLPMFDDTVPPTTDEAGFGALECAQGRLPLVAMDVQSTICDVTAETTVRQTFRNSLSETIEATYIFPLPDRAAVTSFRLRVADRTIEGQLKERGQAREDYDQAIEQGHRAAIAEEERSGVFTMRVGNLPPKENAVVELTLVGPLPVSNGEATYRFPLVVAPRFTPGIPLDGPAVGAGVTPDTDQVPDASRVTPPILLPGFPNPVRLSIQVAFTSGLADDAAWASRITSSLHSTVTDEGPPWTVHLQPGERLDRDFILRFPVTASKVAASMQASVATADRPGVLALTLFPPDLNIADTSPPRQIVFVLDRSGSMGGWKMVAARRAVGRMIDTLLDRDRFAVLAFDTVIEQAQEKLVAGSNRERWQALEWLGKVDARGGTQLGPAINSALGLFDHNDPTGASSRMIVIVTDGQVSGEDAVLRQLSRTSGGQPPKVFTIGIDRAVNAGFLTRLADLGGGQCELVESEDRLDEAMQSIHRLIAEPVLKDVQLIPLNVDLVSNSLAPSRVIDLYADRPATIYGRHLALNPDFKLQVKATLRDGSPWVAEVSAGPAENGLLSAMWGRARVRDLEDEYASGRNSDSAKLMQQVVDISLECHVLSRFTAYVAVDDAEVITDRGRAQSIVQPVELPSGWANAQMLQSIPPNALSNIVRCIMPPAASAASALRSRKTKSSQPDDQSPMSFRPASRAPEPPPASLIGEFCELAIEFCDIDDGIANDAGSNAAFDDQSEPLQILMQILTAAVQQNATEIFILPRLNTQTLLVKYRIAGQLAERDSQPYSFLTPMSSHLRRLAGMIDQPTVGQQTGTAQVTLNGVNLTLEITITPTADGDSITIVRTKTSTTPPAGPTRKRKQFWT